MYCFECGGLLHLTKESGEKVRCCTQCGRVINHPHCGLCGAKTNKGVKTGMFQYWDYPKCGYPNRDVLLEDERWKPKVIS